MYDSVTGGRGSELVQNSVTYFMDGPQCAHAHYVHGQFMYCTYTCISIGREHYMPTMELSKLYTWKRSVVIGWYSAFSLGAAAVVGFSCVVDSAVGEVWRVINGRVFLFQWNHLKHIAPPSLHALPLQPSLPTHRGSPLLPMLLLMVVLLLMLHGAGAACGAYPRTFLYNRIFSTKITRKCFTVKESELWRRLTSTPVQTDRQIDR